MDAPPDIAKAVANRLQSPDARTFMSILARIKANTQFTVGDYVVERSPGCGQYYTENVQNSGIPARHKIVWRDPESGLTFAQLVTSSGKLGAAFCLEFRHKVYELDREFTDSIILGGEFDPKTKIAEAKAHITRVKKYNASIRVSTKNMTPKEFKTWCAANLKIGVEFWWTYNANSRYFRRAIIQRIDPDAIPSPNDFTKAGIFQRLRYVDSVCSVYDTDLYRWGCIYLQKPMSYSAEEER